MLMTCEVGFENITIKAILRSLKRRILNTHSLFVVDQGLGNLNIVNVFCSRHRPMVVNIQHTIDRLISGNC